VKRRTLCAWCHSPRHRDARGRFQRALDSCWMKRYARTLFLEVVEESARTDSFYRPAKGPVKFIGAVPNVREV